MKLVRTRSILTPVNWYYLHIPSCLLRYLCQSTGLCHLVPGHSLVKKTLTKGAISFAKNNTLQ